MAWTAKQMVGWKDSGEGRWEHPRAAIGGAIEPWCPPVVLACEGGKIPARDDIDGPWLLRGLRDSLFGVMLGPGSQGRLPDNVVQPTPQASGWDWLFRRLFVLLAPMISRQSISFCDLDLIRSVHGHRQDGC
ncbi:hypothetical protein XANCAGTX0491_007412 [Xanthoria calcicola]